MKKFTAICCGSSDINVERPRRLVKHSKKKTSERSSGETLDRTNMQELWALKHQNSYSVSDARFLTDGEPHSIVISFEGRERTQMKLTIDDEVVYEVETKETLRGKLELHTSEGMVVDFFWDLVEIPKKFSFYTREFSSNTRNVAGSSRRGSLEEEVAYYLDPWQFSYTHIHALEIFGR